MPVDRPPDISGVSDAFLEARAALLIGTKGIYCEGKFVVIQFTDDEFWIMTNCAPSKTAGDYTGDSAVWPQSVFNGNGSYSTAVTECTANDDESRVPMKAYLVGNLGTHLCNTKPILKAILDGEDDDTDHSPTLEDVFLTCAVLINFDGAWVIGTTYPTGAVVTYDGTHYIALRETVGDQPDTSPSDWEEYDAVDVGQALSVELAIDSSDSTT